MPQTIKKHSATEIIVTNPVEKIMSLADLKRGLEEFEAWVLGERQARQALITEAQNLGVTESPQANLSEEIL